MILHSFLEYNQLHVVVYNLYYISVLLQQHLDSCNTTRTTFDTILLLYKQKYKIIVVPCANICTVSPGIMYNII